VTSRGEVEQAASAAAARLVDVRGKLTEARSRYLAADAAWLESGTKRTREARAEASDEMERLTTLEGRAEDEWRKAAAAVSALDAEEKKREFDGHIAALAKVDEAIATGADTFVAIDRQIDEAVYNVAGIVANAAAVHARAMALAGELRIQGIEHKIAKPSLGAARLVVLQRTTRARIAEQRLPLAGWLAPDPAAGDWRKRDMSFEQLDANMRAAAAARQEEERAATQAATIGAVLTAINAPPPKPAPAPPATTTETNP
jgi:hypothetical protein